MISGSDPKLMSEAEVIREVGKILAAGYGRHSAATANRPESREKELAGRPPVEAPCESVVGNERANTQEVA